MFQKDYEKIKSYVVGVVNGRKLSIDADEIINEVFLKFSTDNTPYNLKSFLDESFNLIYDHQRSKPSIVSIGAAYYNKSKNSSFDKQCKECADVKHYSEYYCYVNELGKLAYKGTCKDCVNEFKRKKRERKRYPKVFIPEQSVAILNGLYHVTNSGKIISAYTGKEMKPYKEKTGYLTVNLNKKKYYLHRVIAAAWVENPLNLPEVNHNDGNKENNSTANLLWTTHQQNIEHAYRVLKVHLSEKNIAKFQRRKKRNSLVAV